MMLFIHYGNPEKADILNKDIPLMMPTFKIHIQVSLASIKNLHFLVKKP